MVLLPLASPVLGAPNPQTDSPESLAQTLLETMTPRERVGQLFLVNFEGSAINDESRISELISQYHIGGVTLNRGMDNFVDPPNTLQAAYSLIFDLQQAKRNASLEEQVDLLSGESFTPVYVPLFVGISQEGDGYPNDQMLNALSPQPSAMTLGATWQPELAAQAGELLGSELASLGINLLLGPSLDVLENPNPESFGDIAARSFGGDPYWVGQMGQAYIRGVHAGSANQVAVVSKHLPGLGSADRPIEEEIPTIRKSLSQLTENELVPFFAVSGNSPDTESQSDAMLLAHIRYQGFQGNIRDTTRPVSFDAQAFSELMALPAFAEWRNQGGLIISDQLGTRAVRRSYDVTEQDFNAQQVALDAFLAGNDVLYLGDFVASGDADSFSTIVDTSNFFTQKYREDLAFAERVNESVLRILTLKYELYPSFNISLVVPSTRGLETIGSNNELIFEIGRQAATLLSPDVTELPAVLSEPPQLGDQVVYIVDSYNSIQCSDCEESAVLATDAFELAAEDLYGPFAGNRIAPGNLTSYSFRQLMSALDSEAGAEDIVLSALTSAEWVIFAVQDLDSERSDSTALKRLLSERPDLIQDKLVIVFALNAPFYLDATDITKVSAYYALYNKQNEMATIAARLLFQEISAPGASPVSVAGSGYELIEATSPDPEQIIPLAVNLLGEAEEGGEERISFQAGDLLELQAGPILDNNGHIVPDNTAVAFFISISSEGSPIERSLEANSVAGSAQVSYSIESEGSLEISVSSGFEVAQSEILQFDVIGINPAGIAALETENAIADADSGNEDEAVATPDDASSGFNEQTVGVAFSDWLLAVVVSLFFSLFNYQVGSIRANVRWGVRWALLSFIGGMISVIYLGLGLPGSSALIAALGIWGIVLFTLLGAAIGLAIGWAWKSNNAQSQ
jgi:beta-N-acetylhexosaminidase